MESANVKLSCQKQKIKNWREPSVVPRRVPMSRLTQPQRADRPEAETTLINVSLVFYFTVILATAAFGSAPPPWLSSPVREQKIRMGHRISAGRAAGRTDLDQNVSLCRAEEWWNITFRVVVMWQLFSIGFMKESGHAGDTWSNNWSIVDFHRTCWPDLSTCFMLLTCWLSMWMNASMDVDVCWGLTDSERICRADSPPA